MTLLLWVGLGGFAGAIARFGSVQLAVRIFGLSPAAATLAVNVVGCFAIGVLLTLFTEGQRFGEGSRHFWIIGLLGSFTTFSTFGWETHELLREDQLLRALLHVGGHLILGLGFVAIGVLAGRGLLGAPAL